MNSKAIFKKYNDEAKKKRCPRGYSKIRDVLDGYAIAAVNLYGVISVEELIDIFNEDIQIRLTAQDLKDLLLPKVLKEKMYCFYKDYVVHYICIDNFELADYIVTSQKDKPKYRPDLDEFLCYMEELYQDSKEELYWNKVHRYIFGYMPHFSGKYDLVDRLLISARMFVDPNAIFNEIEHNNIQFKDEEQLSKFLELTSTASNNTHCWVNNGHTPNEILKMAVPSKPQFSPGVKKIGVNEKCPCGSGKKYKKCCMIVEDGSDRLTFDQTQRFYELWYGVMGFVNEKYEIINEKIKPVYPNDIGDEEMYEVRNALWKNVDLIDEYITESNLSSEDASTLKMWKEKHIHDKFMIVKYTKDYALLVQVGDSSNIYGVKGISRSIKHAMNRPLPIAVETVLIPFEGKIIYDTYFGNYAIDFSGKMTELMLEEYANISASDVIIKI